MIVAVYRALTGEILRTVDAPYYLAILQAGTDEAFIVGRASDLTQYVKDGAIVDRPSMPGGLSPSSVITNTAAILTAPEGAEVEIIGPVNGSTVADADGLAISSDIPGTYTLKVKFFPYLDAEYTLEITEP